MRWYRRFFGKRSQLPRDADVVLRRALLAILDRDWNTAEELLEQAVKLDSKSAENYIALAHLYRMRGDLGRAIRIHQNVLLRPELDRATRIDALMGLANDFRNGGFLDRAIGKYIEVLEVDPDCVAALRELVPLLVSSRDIQTAISMERRLARVDRPKGDEAADSMLLDIAEVAREEGRFGDARRVLKRVLRRNPQSARAWMIRGDLAADRGRKRAAISAWKHISELDPRSGAGVYGRLRKAWVEMKREDAFEEFLREILAKIPGQRDATLALVETLSARGDFDTGLKELRSFLELSPHDLQARALFGRLLLDANRRDEAIEEYRLLLGLLADEGLLTAREHSA